MVSGRPWHRADAGQDLAQPELAPYRVHDQRATSVTLNLAALVCTQGTSLFMTLDVESVQGARMRIESAIMLSKQPPAEKLEAFGDEAIAREAKRRGLLRKTEPTSEP